MISKHSCRRLALGASAAVLCFAANVAQAQQSSANMPAMSASAASMAKGGDTFSQSMMTGMQKMQAMKPSGDTDKDFAMMMRIHHQQALDMAQTELSQGKSGEMKAMARKIISAQKREIAEFDSWLKKHP